jgi:superfamily II DNA or RNA helicase
VSQDDLSYLPLDQGLAWLAQLNASRVLIRGDLNAATAAVVETLVGEVRQLPPNYPTEPLHDGVYGVMRRGHWEGLIVVGEREPTAPSAARHRFTDDGPRQHLGLARDALLDQWDDAAPFTGSSPLVQGDVVRLLGSDRIGKVVNVTRTALGYQVRVAVDGEEIATSAESLSRIDGDPRSPDFWIQGAPASAADIGLTLTWTKLRQPLTDTLYSYRASKTVFRAYQFIPALKILSSPTGRLLIADEVGLGKTIEAGIVWRELEQRSPMRRSLVVAPSSLGLKWRTEMSRRFDRDLEMIKPPRLLEFAEDLLAGGDPELNAIISLESLRTANAALERLSEIRPRFDLIVVDEAHALRNTGTRSNVMGSLLSDWADHLLFLSATPINLRSDDLYNLLTLLDDGLFLDKEVFQLQLEPNRHLNAAARIVALGRPTREALEELKAIQELDFGGTVTSRADFSRLEAILEQSEPLSPPDRAEVKRLVAELNTLSGVLCRTRKIDVPDKKAVREPHQIEVHWDPDEKELYDQIVGNVMSKALERGTPPGFAMQMPLRQAASCLPAVQRQIARQDVNAFVADIDDADEELDAEGLVSLTTIAERPRLAKDSKFDALRERLLSLRQQGLRQAMIFSTFRGTIAYLVERLSQDFTTQELHGGIAMADRQPIIDEFRDGQFELLVASEVASEGLDFEFCNVLVNYDLPWNPMRVEQRIGRLDRFGQLNDKILILNMHVPGTIETDILERLYARIGVFSDSIGDLEPILRDEFREVTTHLLDPRLTANQRMRRADEIAVAIEQRAAILRRVEEETATLSTVDQLEVEGMDHSGPSEGRYVGAREIEGLIASVVRTNGGTLVAGDRNGVHVLRGTPELSDLVWRYQSRRRTGGTSAIPFQARLRNGDPIEVTFDSDLASARDVELLAARHPLTELALDYLEQESLRLHRYGIAEVSDVPPGRRFAVSIDLIEQSGIRPAKELWATALDLQTLAPDEIVGGRLLAALAEGRLRDPSWGRVTNLSAITASLRDAVWQRRQSDEPRRRTENEVLAKGRLEAKEASLKIKLQKAQSTLELVQRDGRDQRIVRMHQGHIRNLEQDIEGLRGEYESQMEFSLTSRPIAVLEVIGPAT